MHYLFAELLPVPLWNNIRLRPVHYWVKQERIVLLPVDTMLWSLAGYFGITKAGGTNSSMVPALKGPMSSSDLGRKLNDPWSQLFPTVGARLVIALDELLQHAGQVGYIRGLLHGKGWQEFWTRGVKSLFRPHLPQCRKYIPHTLACRK